jgi:hypothetical protein
MTRTTNARLAGFTYLFYIAVAFPDMVLMNRATSGQGIAAKLANVAQHVTDVRISIALTLLSGFSALVLGVTLYAITRDEDRDLAMIAMMCRVGEGITGVAGIPGSLRLLWLATTTGPNAPDPAAAQALAAFTLQGNATLSAALFAVGSTLFCWLLLRGRIVPVWLAWLGFLGSALVAVVLPLQLAQFLTGPVTQLMWLPVAAFEIVVAFWLMIKGAAMPVRASK